MNMLTIRSVFYRCTVWIILCYFISSSTALPTNSVTLACKKDYPDYLRFTPNFAKYGKRNALKIEPAGSSVDFECPHDACPAAFILWYKNGLLLTSKNHPKMRFLNDTLTIKHLESKDSGNYTCKIENKIKSIKFTFTLVVNFQPVVSPIFKNRINTVVYATPNNQAVLSCDFIKNEETTLQWFKLNTNQTTYEYLMQLNDGVMDSDDLLNTINFTSIFNEVHVSNLTEDHALIIKKLKPQDIGTYMCIAENRFGKSLKFLKLAFEKSHFSNEYYIILFFIISMLASLTSFILIKNYYFKIAKKKFMIEKEKNYIIKNKIVLDYSACKSNENDLAAFAPLTEETEYNAYNNCPILMPRIDIKKERIEIIGKSEDIILSEFDNFEIELDPKWEIDNKCLVLEKILGKGEFGVVVKGVLYEDEDYEENLNECKKQYINDYVNNQVIAINNSVNANNVSYNSSNNYCNFNPIIGHFQNNHNLISLMNVNAFSNNYYGLNSSYNCKDGVLNTGIFNKKNNESVDFENSKNEDKFRKGRVVAVKKLRDDFTEFDLKNFVSEMIMMKLIGNHPNIINLIGTCTQSGPFYVIMEYAEKGNLKDFLKGYRSVYSCLPEEEAVDKLTTKDLILFGWQIACGMQYLTSRHCVHRDLAARNILVTADLTLKVADFGLSRNTGQSEYYRKASDSIVPIKWLAPECISENLYTTQSDVWSFGILLWEIASLGSSPYEHLMPKYLYYYLREGNRMKRPEWSSNELYRIMLECWNWKADQRPSFDELVVKLDFLAKQEVQLEYLNLTKEYIPTPPSSDDEDNENTLN